jgi:hypothetical protein
MSLSTNGSLPGRIVGAVDEGIRSLAGRLAGCHPRVDRLLVAGRERYAAAFVRAIALRNRVRYDAPPDPDRLLVVDPDRIERVAEASVSKFRLSGVVRGGDWDQTDDRFEEMLVFRSHRRHFEEGVPWTETELYRWILDEIAAGRERWGCDSHDAVIDRFERLDALYESIRTNGYRTQSSLADESTADPIGDARGPRPDRGRDEITVHIGRSGDLLFEDGRNRLSMVKLLGVDRIPVRVLLRHRDWQATREAYVNGGIDPADPVTDHPDLRGLSVDGD